MRDGWAYFSALVAERKGVTAPLRSTSTLRDVTGENTCVDLVYQLWAIKERELPTHADYLKGDMKITGKRCLLSVWL